ncbi:MAG: hypothetical protein KDA65_12300 [Planctomycetaceae bacterium]|nr:hypothetical protein [Planctomycetaceae bacterium]
MKRYFLIAAVVAGLFCVSHVDSAVAGGKNWGGGFKKNWNGGHNHNHNHNNWGGHKFHGHKGHNFYGGYYNKPYYGGYGYGGYGYGKGIQINTPGFSFGIYK